MMEELLCVALVICWRVQTELLGRSIYFRGDSVPRDGSWLLSAEDWSTLTGAGRRGRGGLVPAAGPGLPMAHLSWPGGGAQPSLGGQEGARDRRRDGEEDWPQRGAA